MHWAHSTELSLQKQCTNLSYIVSNTSSGTVNFYTILFQDDKAIIKIESTIGHARARNNNMIAKHHYTCTWIVVFSRSISLKIAHSIRISCFPIKAKLRTKTYLTAWVNSVISEAKIVFIQITGKVLVKDKRWRKRQSGGNFPAKTKTRQSVHDKLTELTKHFYCRCEAPSCSSSRHSGPRNPVGIVKRCQASCHEFQRPAW